ncbi:protein GAMETE EXPRESSED 1 [Juglans microcarpa x Juglans regia]|uniref:protein GAMETE EXPRESSED 1 n=1 Tax=Juglans microcarpa x Juglans regia TaxID=2249226 RepID=UPI001B7E13EB|nr:protein GAMETE EXPRESSED 1 [Juglans microcarpa x Juglans regia]
MLILKKITILVIFHNIYFVVQPVVFGSNFILLPFLAPQVSVSVSSCIYTEYISVFTFVFVDELHVSCSGSLYLYNLNWCNAGFVISVNDSYSFLTFTYKDQMGRLLLLLILISFLRECQSWGWSFSSKKETHFEEKDSGPNDVSGIAEFSIDGFNDQKGVRQIETAKRKLVGTNSCWQNAYRHLFAGCSEIFAVDEKRSRFAWHLSDCFQKDSGRPPFPSCDPKSAMAKCLKGLNEYEHRVYLEFYLETNSICHQLQAHAFKQQIERLVNELKNSAHLAEEKLGIMELKTEYLLKNSNEIYDSLNNIDIRVQQVALTSKNVEDHISAVLKHSEAVYEQSKGIAASQSELQERQVEMRRSLEDGMEMLKDSYDVLGHEIDNLRNEAIQIEKEILKVGDAMSLKMTNLQIKADDIGNMAGVSLEKQQQLLDGQSTALEGLKSLTKFQSDALEESRSTLQEFSEYGHRQQEELLRQKEQLQSVHDHLMENSKSILAAQESFESKQASMFIALDKLFALHNAMLLESRLIKSFFVYCISIFIIYMFTSTKQTYKVRPWLYIGLCVTFLIEVAILRVATNDNIEEKSWIINLVRSFFVLAASIQILHAICTYRDYEVLNHQILLTLIEKINGMERHKELPWDLDSEINWSTWIDTDIPEDPDNLGDPDYILPEEVAENSIVTSSITRKYDLRRHCRH